MKKFFNLILAIGLFVITAVGLVACQKPKDLLKNFLLEQDSQTVTDDFVVDSTITVGSKSYKLSWTSSDECIKIADSAVDGKYLCTVVRPEQTKEVTLTVTVNKESKNFKVTVNPIDVYDFTGSYTFPQNKTIVCADFDLATKCTYKGKECTMTWASRNEDYITINEAGNKAVVVESLMEIPVNLACAFSYNGKTSTKTYTVTVSVEKTAEESIVYWYNNTGISQELSGYVLGIATVYSSQYGNISLYMVDDSLTAGYYLYRVKCNAETAAKLVPGAHVVVKGATNTIYKGLMETNSDGNIIVDDKAPLADVNTTVYDITDDVIAGAKNVQYRESSLVSLTGWKIKAKGAAPTAGNTSVILTLEREGKEISVAVSKYMEGFFTTQDTDAVYTAIKTKHASLEVDSYVNVKGILGCDDSGYLINITKAEDITASEAPAAASPAAPVANAIKAVKIPLTIKKNTTIALPASNNGVTITWELTNADIARTVAINDGNLVATPNATGEMINLIATYKVGTEYETRVYYPIRVQLASEDIASIADVLLEAADTEVVTLGKVVAISTTGYVIYDGENAIYVYAKGSTVEAEQKFEHKIGDVVKVTGKKGFYNGDQIVPSESEKVEETIEGTPEVKTVVASDIETYINNTENKYNTEYVKVTGTLSVSGNYFNMNIEGAEVAQVSLKDVSPELKAGLTDCANKHITVTGWVYSISKAKVNNVANTPKYYNMIVNSVVVEDEITVATAKKLPINTVVTVKGIVVAASSRGYVVYDGTDSVYVYAYGSKVTAEKNFKYTVGAAVTVTGATGNYNGPQIVPTSSAAATVEGVTAPAAATWGATEMQAYLATDTTTTNYSNTHIKFTGKVTISGNYFNVEINGVTTFQGSLSYLTDAQKALFTSGNTYEIEGYTIGISTKKVDGVNVPFYMNVIVVAAVAA